MRVGGIKLKAILRRFTFFIKEIEKLFWGIVLQILSLI